MKIAIQRADGSQELIDVKHPDQKIAAQPGATYHPVDDKTAKTPRSAVVKRIKDDLRIEQGDGQAVTIEKFFSDCKPTDRCYATLDMPGGNGTTEDGPTTVTTITQDDGDPVAALLGGQTGTMNDGQVLAFAQRGDVLPAVAVAAADHTLLWAAAGAVGLGAAAGGGGGGGGGGGTSAAPAPTPIKTFVSPSPAPSPAPAPADEPTAAPTPAAAPSPAPSPAPAPAPAPAPGVSSDPQAGTLRIKGVVAAGPMHAGTVEVLAYDADGHLLGRGVVNDNTGAYEIVAAGKDGYSGAVMLVARDLDGAAADNFISEATDQWTNLGTSLAAVGSTPGHQPVLVINITPLTQLAAMKMGMDANAAGGVAPITADATHIDAVNQAVGNFFGVHDILGPVATIDEPGFRSLGGNNAWQYGVALAKLAVLDEQYGSIAATLTHLDTVLTMTAGGAIANSDAAIADIATMRTIANDYNDAAAFDAEAAQGYQVVNIAGVPTVRVEVALPVNAVAGDIVRLHLTGNDGATHTDPYTVTAADVLAGFAAVPVSLASLQHVGTGWVHPVATFTDAHGVNDSDPVAATPLMVDVAAPTPVVDANWVAASGVQAPGFDIAVSYPHLVAGDVLQLQWDGQNAAAPYTVTTQDVSTGHVRFFVAAAAMAGATHGTFSIVATDAAGNSGSGWDGVVVTVTPPALPLAPTQTAHIGSVTESAITHGSVSGPLASGTSTDDPAPMMAGTVDAALVAGQVVAVYDTHDGVTTRLGDAVVTGTSWTFTTPALNAGSHHLNAVVEDSATQLQGPASAAHVVIEQSISVAGVVDGHGLLQGAIAPLGYTDDNHPTISGSLGSATLGAGEAVVIYDGATRLGVASVSGTGWSFTPSAALADGAHSLVAMIEDSATGTVLTGRVVSDAHAFTVVTAATTPTTLVTIDDVSETNATHGSATGTIADGTSTDGTTPLLSGSLSAPLSPIEVLAVYDGSTRLGLASVSGMGWSFAAPALSIGGHVFSAVVENVIGGNRGTYSDLYVINEESIGILTFSDDVGTLQGAIATGGHTDDTRPTLAGSLGAAPLGTNEIVAVYDHGVKIGQASVSGTDWTFTPALALGDGAHALVAMIQDAASTNPASGRVVSETLAFTIDTSGLPPTQTASIVSVLDADASHGSATGPLANGASTDDRTPAIDGSLSAGLSGSQVVAVYDTHGGSTVRLGEATVNSTQWHFDAPTLALGQHTLTAVVENAANGAQGPATPAFTLNQQSIALQQVLDDTGLLQGTLLPLGLTDDALPQLSGSLGSAQLGSGEVVAIYDGNTKIGEAVVSGTSWSFTPGSALADGAHSLRAMVQDHATGNAGNGRVVSDAFGITVLTIASTPTTAASIGAVTENDATNGSATGVFASGTSTDGRTPTLTGTLGAPLGLGEAVAIYDGGSRIGYATVTGTGWSYTTPTLALGDHALTVAVENLVSNTQGPVSAAFVVREQAIAALGVYDDVGTVQGAIAANGATDDARPTFSGTLANATLGANEVVAIYDHGVRIGTAAVAGNGWSFTPAGNLADGSHNLVAIVQDAAAVTAAAGRVSSTGVAFTVDTSALAPTQSISITGALDTNPSHGSFVGVLASGNSTDDRTPVLSGSLSAGLIGSQSVVVYDNGTRLGTAVVTGTAWSFAPGALAIGSHQFTAVVENAISGAQGTPSAAFVVNEQSIAVTQIWDDVGIIQGNLVIAAGITDDDRPTLSGSLGVATLGAGEVVAIYDGATKIGEASVTGNSWSFTPGVALQDGVHSLRAIVQDGSTGTALNGRVVSDAQDFVLLTPLYAPGSHATIVSVSENTSLNGSAIGSFASGTSTDGRTPTLAGTLDAPLGLGDALAVFDGSTLLGYASVAGGSWSFTTPTLALGSHSLTVVPQNSVTGALGTPTAPFVVNVQSIAVSSLVDDVGATTGAIAQGAATDDARPTFSGTLGSATLGSGEVVAIYDGALRIGVASVNGSTGAWTFTPASDLASGSHQWRAMVQDSGSSDPATGRIVSAASSFVLDTSGIVPTQIASIASVTENSTAHGSVAGAFASGTSTDGRTPTLSGTVDAPLIAGQVVAVYDNGVRLGVANVNGTAWSYTTPTLAAGAHSLVTQVENAATGAHGPASGAFTLIEQTLGFDNLLGWTGAIQVVVDGVLGLFVGTSPSFTGSLNGAGLGAGEAIVLYDGNVRLGEATVTGGNWSFTPATSLTTGVHHVSAMIQASGANDAHAGRVVSSVCDFTIDLNVSIPTQLVTVSAAIDALGLNGSLIGSIGAGNSTDTTTPTLQGTLSAGLQGAQVLAVYDGAVKLGNAVVTGTSWSFTPDAPLALGNHTLAARVENPVSGLNGLPSLGFSLNLQTIGNLALADDVGAIHGAVVSGGVTDDSRPTLTGTLGAATLGFGEAVMVYDTVGGVTTQIGAAVVVGTNWSFTPLLPLADGAHHLSAMIQPLIGGTASTGRVVSGALDFTLDTSTAPTQLVAIQSVTDALGLGGSKIGALLAGATIDDTTPTIAGSLSASLSGAQAVAVYDTVGGVTSKLGYATVDAGNALHWSFEPGSALAAGGHLLTARVENVATGSQGSVSLGFGLTERPISIAINDNVGALQGDVLGFGTGITDDATLSLSGHLGTPLGLIGGLLESVKVYDNGVQIGTASVSAFGTGADWSFNTGTLASGTHNFAVHVESLLGSFTVATGASVTVAASDPLLTSTDNAHGSTGLARYDVAGNTTQLDLTKVSGAAQPHMDIISLAAGANTLKIGLADVLQGGTDNFTSAHGFAGLTASGKHQLLVDGSAGTVTMADASWTSLGTVSNGGHTYNVYEDSNHLAQLLVDTHLSRSGPIGG